MKIKTLLLIASALVINIPDTFAQSTARGYLGKRNMVSYSLNFNDTYFTSLGLIGVRNAEGYNTFNLRHGFNYHRAISKKWMFGGGFTMAFDGMKPPGYILEDAGGYARDYQLDVEPFNTRLSTYALRASFRYYYTSNAMVGRFYGIMVEYAMHSATMDFSNYYSNDNNSYYSTRSAVDVSASSLRVGMEFGRTRIINHKWAIEYGLDLGIALSPFSIGETFFNYNNTWNSSEHADPDDLKSESDLEEWASPFLPATYSAGSTILFRLAFGYIFE